MANISSPLLAGVPGLQRDGAIALARGEIASYEEQVAALLADRDAAHFLDHTIVNERLRPDSAIARHSCGVAQGARLGTNVGRGRLN